MPSPILVAGFENSHKLTSERIIRDFPAIERDKRRIHFYILDLKNTSIIQNPYI